MARMRNNLFVKGLSGQIGNQLVYRVRYGRQEVYAKPDMSNREWSPDQLKWQNKMTQAVHYAKWQKENPDTWVLYVERGKKDHRVPFQVAISDSLRPPEIAPFHLDNFNLRQGDTFTITATDDFMVARVDITLLGAGGEEAESGEAQDIGVDQWRYTVSNSYEAGELQVIRACAWDLPGNCVEMELERLVDQQNG